MKKIKWLLSGLLTAIMLVTTSFPAYAAVSDARFSDVAANSWYAGAVDYVQDNGLMSGTSATTFSPDTTANRAMLAAILYRASGSPAFSGSAGFTDVANDAYYADAVTWAAEKSIVSGYGGGLFGSNDPVSREQIATILWRYAGSPNSQQGQNFADESAIANYATVAVDWARTNGIVNGKEGNRFDPKGNATRAQVATILCNYMTLKQVGNQTPNNSKSNILVVYFSATGGTEAVGKTIAETLNADRYEIVPEDPYTSADLNWTEPSSRVNAEHENPKSRPAIAGQAADLSGYDTIFIGYPIWWGEAPNIVRTFMEETDLAGKTIIPFCTSASSNLGSSAETLKSFAPDTTWLSGQRFSNGVSSSDVREWVKGLNLKSSASLKQGSRSLVVYFSMPETANPNNMTKEEDNSAVVIDGEVLGNTQYMASVIQKNIGADSFRIVPETAYPVDHTTLVGLAAEEQKRNARPAIQGSVNLTQYDTVFIGYPIWWSDMPMILHTFLDTYDLSGKTIVPFSTHGGSGFAGTRNKIAQLEPNAKILDGLTISRDDIQSSENEIVNWVKGLNIK